MKTYVCDCCERTVDYVRGSMWHGDDRICKACFFVWYDPDRDTGGTRDGIKVEVLRAEKAGTFPFSLTASEGIHRVADTPKSPDGER